MAYLLDTCALSEFTKPRPSAAVDTWFANLSMGTEYVSVLTLGELEKGIAKLKPSHRRDELERWFVELCARFEGRTTDGTRREHGPPSTRRRPSALVPCSSTTGAHRAASSAIWVRRGRQLVFVSARLV